MTAPHHHSCPPAHDSPGLQLVFQIPYKPDEAEEFERSWLLLADIHIQGGKFDLAQDLCQKALKYNKSCAKAWEFMGAVMEREQSYKDAAEHYEKAWKHENQASAQVGWFRLFVLVASTLPLACFCSVFGSPGRHREGSTEDACPEWAEFPGTNTRRGSLSWMPSMPLTHPHYSHTSHTSEHTCPTLLSTSILHLPQVGTPTQSHTSPHSCPHLPCTRLRLATSWPSSTT